MPEKSHSTAHDVPMGEGKTALLCIEIKSNFSQPKQIFKGAICNFYSKINPFFIAYM